MSILRIFATVALLTGGTDLPAFAQAAIQEPGAYAFYHHAFNPLHREWLARPFERVFFAGEHTSLTWQGYMNGAVETGLRAAKEVGLSFAAD